MFVLEWAWVYRRVLNLPDQSADRTNLVKYVRSLRVRSCYFGSTYLLSLCVCRTRPTEWCVMVVMVLVYSQTIKVCFQTVRPWTCLLEHDKSFCSNLWGESDGACTVDYHQHPRAAPRRIRSLFLPRLEATSNMFCLLWRYLWPSAS